MSAMDSRARTRSRRLSIPIMPIWGARPINTVSSTVKRMSVGENWETRAMRQAKVFLEQRETSSPMSTVFPESGLSMPAATLRRVDFPEPLGPTITEKLPLSTAKETLSSAVTPP